MRKLGIIAFSDGRKRVHEGTLGMNQNLLDRVVDALRETGEIELIVANQIVDTSRKAKEESQKMICKNVEGTIFCYNLWAYPHLTVIAAQNGKPPFLCLSNLNPQYPGLVGMMASAGSLDQLGIVNKRIWGDIKEKDIIKEVLIWARAASAMNRLKGETYGLIGGRSMGMYTGAADTRQWQVQFGVDIDHTDQLLILDRAKKISKKRIEEGFEWLKGKVRSIEWEEPNLTEEILKRQICHYLATKDLVREREYDFIGIKCTPDLSETQCTQCISQAFFNDPYDWEELRKSPLVCSCEADCDGAMTMQILHHISDNQPVVFFDFRHYYPEDDLYVFSNCGSQTTWYAARSDDPSVNLREVSIKPQLPLYHAGGGGTICYMAGPGEITIARLCRRRGRYWMAIMLGSVVRVAEEKMNDTSPEWPQAFVKLKVSSKDLISQYGCNHAHAVHGNYVNELLEVCNLFNIETKVFG